MNTLFPRFSVAAVSPSPPRARLIGSVSSVRFGRETWVGDRYLGYLKHGSFLAPGRWHLGKDHWEFALDQPQHLNDLEGIPELEVLDGYWGERVALVLDARAKWTTDQWSEKVGHEHCTICWATISESENRDHFVATSGERVCAPCYREYVSSRSLGFIAAAAQQGDATDRPPAGRRSPER